MKEFLRFQISGSVFLLWLILFNTGFPELETLKVLIKESKTEKIVILVGVAAALPIGVIIHQFSVFLKNYLFAPCWPCLSDSPATDDNKNIKDAIINLDTCKEAKKYIFRKISNLNSYYYARFDNGVLSPLLAFLTVSIHGDYKYSTVILALIIGIATASYIPRLCKEIGMYKEMLGKLQSKKCQESSKNDSELEPE